jgi:hypothetical protein
MTVDHKIETIIKQARMWSIYGRLIPFVAMLAGLALYLINSTVSLVVLYASWFIFIATCLIWWFWVIKTLVEITSMFQTVVNMIKTIRVEIHVVRKDVKSLENSSNE